MRPHGRQQPRTFSKSAAPEGYVAGLGRGAVAFTTRSDAVPLSGGAGRGSGPLARTDFGAAPKGYVAGAGRGAGGFGETKATAESTRETLNAVAESHAAAHGSAGDREADEIWDAVERRLADRHPKKRQRVKNDHENNLESRGSNGGSNLRASSSSGISGMRIADQFADLKQQLKTVSYAEWDAIPEARSGVREHRREYENYAPVSDAMLLSAAGLGGTKSGSNALGVERGRAMLNQLDGEDDGAVSSVDAKDYLASLEGMGGAGVAARIGDIRKARILFKSVTANNPTHAPGWIAAARLEEAAGKLLDARKIIAEGCRACPDSEDVWLEAARLNTPANAKVIIENGIRHLPRSIKLWYRAADLEGDQTERRKRVMRRALETMPTSEELWKAAIDLEENKADAHMLLARATECVPESVDLWLALAQLEDYKQARVVLQTARKRLPKEPKIWIAACVLEEAQVKSDSPEESRQKLRLVLDKVVNKAVQSLSIIGEEKTGTLGPVTREDWLQHARTMEEAGSVETCRAIIRGTLTLGIAEDERKRTWFADAQEFENEEHLVCVRAVFAEAMSIFSGHRDVLLRAVAFESRKGDKTTLTTLLHEAVERCPKAELFWLMAAKETWKTLDNPREARQILDRALDAGHSSERVWLAAFKLEWETGNLAQAREVIRSAQEKCPTPAMWIKAALLARVELANALPNSNEANNLLKETQDTLKNGCEKYPKTPKLWLMAGQLELNYVAAKAPVNSPDRSAAVEKARRLFLEGLQYEPHSIPLWVAAAQLEKQYSSPVKARSVLELARVKNPDSPELWLESVRLEKEQRQHGMAEILIAKAVQSCPKAGILWAHIILTAPRPEQRAKSADAMERCENDARVFCALGRLFAGKNKVKVARKWFEAAVDADGDYGDAWAYFLYFERTVANDADAAMQIQRRCLQAEPRHGELWQQITKQDKLRLASNQEKLDAVLQHITNAPNAI